MWWRRALPALLLLFAVAGCGFQPLYGRADPEFNADLAAISVTPIPERIGQLLTMELRDTFNPTGARVDPRWILAVNLTTTRREVGIRSDGTASRIEYDIRALLGLRGVQDKAYAFTNTSRFFTAVDIVENKYSMVVAEQDAERRAARELAEDIRTRIALYLKRHEAETAKRGAGSGPGKGPT